ncbi:hypothetical protein K437DRAFT_227481 [Tilletiaria anomala UBC 951]|uniref:3,4-dihydroxy-2-butanone 4-phosphate synthase n=1 Tax=Tilletiaria anomala (strain ATCC 24038 / CBS 436.72 / UBC 951) TaxID=1037660 RepID=A0A066VFC6_TILAU|nr:uncharacterized protein K437DRAFT_227481 [Tilletiaria anomala UBC 951]KDN40176.1 hypothetical protein K437DRAFT_227481 [Tilletiaria anomala UBC 951]
MPSPAVASAGADVSLSTSGFNTIDSALESFSRGEFVIVLDDEDRENEGDLIVAAESITTEQMAWFIRHTSGYICISVHPSVLTSLHIPMMVPNNTEKHKTAYTVTVDYKHGTTTGISAHDRALTARKLALAGAEEPNKSSEVLPEDFSRPGHMVPLRYTEGGVRVRKGHTEAGVDLCRACGKAPVALLCELVDPSSAEGNIAARDACLAFATKHNLKVITIEALRRWREEREGSQIPELANADLQAKDGQELDLAKGVQLEKQMVAESLTGPNGPV